MEWKKYKYIFETENDTLLESNDLSEMGSFINDIVGENNGELILTNVHESMSYITFRFLGYTFMIRK